MKSEKSFVLWILYGFLVFFAIKWFIEFVFYFHFHLSLELKILPYYIKMSSYVLAIFIFDFVSISIIKQSRKFFKSVDYLKLTPSVTLVVTIGLMAVFFKPLINRLDSWHLEKLLNIPTFDDYLNPIDLLNVYSTLNITISSCFWVIITFLLVYFYNFNKLKKHF